MRQLLKSSGLDRKVSVLPPSRESRTAKLPLLSERQGEGEGRRYPSPFCRSERHSCRDRTTRKQPDFNPNCVLAKTSNVGPGYKRQEGPASLVA